MKFRLTAIVTLFALTLAHSQTKKWTLEECVLYAVEHNLSVAQFELDLENATIDKSDALGNMLPNISASADVSERSGLVIDPNSNTNVSGKIFTVAPGINGSITLFDGLRNVKRMHRAKMNAVANQYRLENLKDDIRLNVANAYLQVISNKERLKVAQAQYAVTEQDLRRTAELVESGVVPKGDLLEVEATAANQEQQIVNAEGQVQISKIALAQLLQIRDYDNFDTVDEGFEVPPSEVLSYEPNTIFAKAMEFRNDIKQFRSNVDLAEQDVEIAKGALYPTLAAFFSYNTFYSNQFQVVRDPETGAPIIDPSTDKVLFFRDTFKDQLWLNDGISYGFRLNIPIFSGWSSRNNIKRAKIGLEKSKLDFEQTKMDLENDINRAHVDVRIFGKSYEAAQKTLEARRLAFQYTKERFDVGLMNAFEYGQAQARVDNAEAEVVRTKYEYIFRLKILEFYFGIPISLD